MDIMLPNSSSAGHAKPRTILQETVRLRDLVERHAKEGGKMENSNQTMPCVKLDRPITEQSNTKSKNIDTATANEIIDMLHDCEEEMFNGWQNYQALHDDEALLRKFSKIARYTASLMVNTANNSIILSGCGTSGRIAFFLAAKMNNMLKEKGLPQCFDYIIAGGNKALTHSVEAFEDSPQAGKEALIKVSKGKGKVLFIGISCGLSAPFVAGQIDHCLSHLDTFLPVLLGFNPINMVRDRPIEGWEHTMLSVAKRLMLLERSDQGFIWNPVVGPEAITGSSRMKGGGATKLILETCFMTALSLSCISSKGPITEKNQNQKVNSYTAKDASNEDKLITSLFKCYQQVWETSFEMSKEQLPKLIEQAGRSLLVNGHVYYIGWDTWGLLGLIDASECPPTFGSDFCDVRGFLKGGLIPLASPQEMDTSRCHDPVEDESSLEFFKRSILPTIAAEDTIIFLMPSNGGEMYQEMSILLRSVMQKTQQIGVITTSLLDECQQDFESCTLIRLGDLQENMMDKLQDAGLDRQLEKHVLKGVTELALKSSLNAISTGAHIAKGKVYQNYMVDLRLSNSKLLERGIGIVARCAECSIETARDAVMRSIYRTDDIISLSDITIASIIQTAGNVERVVPIAIILAIKGCTVKEALDHQERAPAIRHN